VTSFSLNAYYLAKKEGKEKKENSNNNSGAIAPSSRVFYFLQGLWVHALVPPVTLKR